MLDVKRSMLNGKENEKLKLGVTVHNYDIIVSTLRAYFIVHYNEQDFSEMCIMQGRRISDFSERLTGKPIIVNYISLINISFEYIQLSKWCQVSVEKGE